MGYTYELGPVYSGSARPRAVKDRRLHTAPITRDPRLDRARDNSRRALKHYRAADQSAAFFDFHRFGKKQKYKAYHSIGLFAFLQRVQLIQGLKLPCGFFNRCNGTRWNSGERIVNKRMIALNIANLTGAAAGIISNLLIQVIRTAGKGAGIAYRCISD